MVIAYLEKIRDEFEVQKIQLKGQIDSNQNKMKENEKFIDILEQTCDPNYEEFSPRQLNSFNRQKISELREEQHQLKEAIDKLQIPLSEIEEKIAEISKVIYETRKAASDTEQKANDRFEMIQELKLLDCKIEHCRKLFDESPKDCKQELIEIEDMLQKIISSVNAVG